MLIENPEAFKTWLTAVLGPLCDADPAALAKYVYALVKKDKPVDDLRTGMLDQLDVFLQSQTRPFVDRLFDSLDSKDYLTNATVNKEDDAATATTATNTTTTTTTTTITNNTTINNNKRIVLNRATNFVPATVPKQKPAYATEHTLVKVIPDLLEEEARSAKDKRRRAYKSRSRSRSWEGRKVTGGERANRKALWRNRSPPPFERRRSRSGSPVARAPRYRNRSPPPDSPPPPPNRSRSRSRDRPASPKHRRSRDAATPTQDSNPGDGPAAVRGATTLAGIFTHKKRCRDFDERGYCMRGDLCQYDHGTDPVVLEDALSHMLALPMQRPPPRHPSAEYNPLAPDIWSRGGGGSALYATPPPPYFPFLNAPPHAHHPMQRELIPVPIARGENAPPNATALPSSAADGSARTAHVPGAPSTHAAQSENLNAPPSHIVKKKPFDFNRLGPNKHFSAKATGGNCSLELKKVPRGLNDILHLNNHFSKFGKIVNIQVNYEDDPEAALITFSTHTEANVAYKSTEAVLNNRFIKVFWHNSDVRFGQSKQENSTASRGPGKDRTVGGSTNHMHVNSNNVNHVSHNKVLINKDTSKNANNTADKAIANAGKEENGLSDAKKNGEEASTNANSKEPGSAVALADTAVKPELPGSVELAAMVRKHGEGTIKLAHDLRRRTQLLLDKQLQQQRSLIQLLESGKLTDAQKEALVSTIKTVQKSIEKTRKELVLHSKVSGPQAKKVAFGALKKVPKSKEENQKEILDTELDLITKQQEGQDVTELQKRLAELKRQQLAFAKPHPVRRTSINRLTSRGRFTKIGAASKSGMFVNQSVDHRPRSFLVSGYESDELEQLVKHFTQYGEIVEHVVDSTTPSLWLQFKSRKIAEQAATKGRQFNDRTLTVTWQPKSAPTAVTVQTSLQENSNVADTDMLAHSPNYSGDCADSLAISAHSPEKSGWTSPLYKFGDSEDEEGIELDEDGRRSWKR